VDPLKRVLVTGADGFIGSHLTERLVRAGFDVTAFVQYNSLNSWGWLDDCDDEVRGHFNVVAGDIRDPFGVSSAIADHEVVMHLAALIAIPHSYEWPQTYVDTNVGGTLNVLKAAQMHGIERVVHTSTSEVYGSARYVPIDEGHPLIGQSPYSASKIGADQMALAFHSSFGTPVTVIRPFNTYGPRQSARAIIPTVMTQIAAGSREIRLGSLSPTRDFSFVHDTVSGFLASVTAPDVIGQVLNLGSNFEISIGETANLIAEVMGVEISVSADPTRIRPARSEVDRLWAATDKAQGLLGWRPQYSGLAGLRDGLALTADWFKIERNLRRYKVDRYNK
jgi:NAD dependent epimerase/dehydratase